MESKPFDDRRSIIKSKGMYFLGPFGIDNGCNKILRDDVKVS
jgi:hypothetical protein